MIKVAMIGAGSVVFSKNLTGDILSFPEFKDATFSYMDIDAERLQVGADLCRKLAKSVGTKPKIESTLNQKDALRGADFVINMVQIGGFNSTLVDFEIPRKYGLNFTIADTTGPGGFFRALRTFPMLRSLVSDMEEVCPNAVLLNYSNPMSMNMQTITRTSGIAAVGLCHSVQGTFNQLMGYIGEDPQNVAFICAGINHMAFYLRIHKNSEDLYPRLFDAMNKPDVYKTNKVRFELMKRLGYFVTESSEHNAEYSSFFIPHGEKVIAEFDIPIDEYLRRCDGIVDEFERMKVFSKSDEPMEVHKSHEYGSTIIHSIVTGKPSVVYGNMPNRGAISNLPFNAIAEAPTLVDRSGMQFTTVGELPVELLAYMQPHVAQHELFIQAALTGRKDHIYQAAMFDPLTAATMSTDKIVEMCDELIAGHGNVLPPLNTSSRVHGSGKKFGAIDPRGLRASWDEAQTKKSEGSIIDWKVIGPFVSQTEGSVSLDQTTEIELRFTKDHGEVDTGARYLSSGKNIEWRNASADKAGFVDLANEIGTHEWALAYAYAELDSIHAREAVLRCGSDDGIKIWLNGKEIHCTDIMRRYSPASDSKNIHLVAGLNKLLVKISNHEGRWGFGVSVSKPNF
jgi:alpha-galactosidase